MNDFTKDELELIRHAVDIYNPVLADPLRIKLQSLIDNYCEHEWIDDPNDGYGYICIECGMKK